LVSHFVRNGLFLPLGQAVRLLDWLNRNDMRIRAMPTYAYVCEKCGHEFEKFQSMKENALSICPQDLCSKKRWGRGKVKRQLGAGAGMIFKGSGFYITDYRSEGYKQAAKKDASSSSPTSSGTSEKKSESKPAKPAKKD